MNRVTLIVGLLLSFALVFLLGDLCNAGDASRFRQQEEEAAKATQTPRSQADAVPDGAAVQGDPDWSVDESPAEEPAPIESQYFSMEELRKNATTAPQQPFFNHWLWLVGIGLALIGLGAKPVVEAPQLATDTASDHPVLMNTIRRFAFRFTAVYFVLFSLPSPLVSMLPVGAFQVLQGYRWLMDGVFIYLAENVFGLEAKIVFMTGSGDSTYDYVILFAKFMASLVVAAIWSLIDRKREERPILRSLLNSFVMLILASILLTYGMMKFSWHGNQFMPISGTQLQTTWGDCSPMGVLWRFMSSSQAYTYFAGLAELTSGLLLVFRRTRLLGALIGAGAMLNVVMLNFCYDVPVKINSSHYLIMAIFLILPHADRLANLLVFNRVVEPENLSVPVRGKFSRWGYVGLKFVLVGWALFFPLGQHYYIQFSQIGVAQASFCGSYSVEYLQSQPNPTEEAESKAPHWQYVRIEEAPGFLAPGSPKFFYFLVKTSGDMGYRGMFTTTDESSFQFQESGQSNFPIGAATFTSTGDKSYQLEATLPSGPLQAKLQKIIPEETRLLQRGFRWVNDVPYNR